MAVHPRIRGERGESQRGWNRWDGSSPHTRGTPESERNQHLLPRFIPAYAGNASAPQQRGCPGSVHPRIRGERYPLPSTKRLKFGSSPHTRGTPISVECWPKSVRFIPAYAGNAGRSADVCERLAVHPRIRGERPVETGGADVAVGSSPHTRGTLFRGGWHRLCSTVHPRIRGERLYCARAAAIRDGSSPHTRGTPLGSHCWRSNPRFIPAYAGNAAPTNALHHGVSVHPRIRGERAVNTILPLMGYGSSPHTRGTPRELQRPG